MAIPRRRVDLVPPPQPDQPPPRDVLQIVEIGREQEDRDDEDEDEVFGDPDAEEVDEEGGCWLVGLDWLVLA